MYDDEIQEGRYQFLFAAAMQQYSSHMTNPIRLFTMSMYSSLYTRDVRVTNCFFLSFLGSRFCCQFLLTRCGDVIHPQLRPLGLGTTLEGSGVLQFPPPFCEILCN